MDDQLKIIIQALIDKQKTTSQINAQIKQIKTEALKIGIEVNDKTISSALKEQTKFVVGQSVKYQLEKKKNNKNEDFNKISPVNDDASFTPGRPSGGSSGGGKFDQTGAMVGNAISNAVNLVCHGKIEMKDLEPIAKRICEVSRR